MRDVILILLYTILSVIFLQRIVRKNAIRLTKWQVSFSFIIKVAFGLMYGFIFLKYYGGDDTWQYHATALENYKELIRHPGSFFTYYLDLTSTSDPSIIFGTENSLWNNLEDELYLHLLVIFDLFSFGSYYVNVVVFCLIVFMGHLWIYRLFTEKFPHAAPLLMLIIFFTPVILFWLSGVRKDGILFVAVSVALFYFNRLLNNSFRFRNLLLFITGCLFIGLLRNFLLLCLVPGLFAWFLVTRYRANSFLSFSGVYILMIICFFASGKAKGFPDLPARIAERQYSFLNLKAHTRLPLDSLKSDVSTYWHVLPQALNHTFLRPYVTEGKSLLRMVSALDNLFFLGVLALACIFPQKKPSLILRSPVILICILSSVFGYIFIGYLVPFPGAIVRYKVIFELLLLCCFVTFIDPSRLKKYRAQTH